MSQIPPTPRQRIHKLLINPPGNTDGTKSTKRRNHTVQPPTATFLDKVFSIRRLWPDEISKLAQRVPLLVGAAVSPLAADA